MTAEQLVRALGGGPWRNSSRGVTARAHCPAHRDKHPSLDITLTTHGATLFICRAGCSQAEVLGELVALGLWSEGGRHLSQPRVPVRWERNGPPPPPCCLRHQPRCEHWLHFDREYLVAVLLGNIETAIAEIEMKYATASLELNATALRLQLEFALPFSAIVPLGIAPRDAEKTIELMVLRWSSTRPQETRQASCR